MSDEQITDRIEALVAEERALERQEAQDAGDDRALAADRERLAQVRVELDRIYDLLRQRRALREAGRDPAEAQPRDGGTVEDYLQ
jgi:IS5 family transposase